MATKDRMLIDGDAMTEAISVLRDAADPAAIPALDPTTWDWSEAPIVLRPDGSVLDGHHRIIGVAKWMLECGMGLDDYYEVPALCVTAEEEATHPDGSTPAWWVRSLTVR